MALGLLYTCRCGERFKAYVPKQKLFRGLCGRHVDWAAIDSSEEAEGGVEQVKRMAAFTGATYVDLRMGGARMKCDTCHLEVDLLAYFTAILTYSNRRATATDSAAGRKRRA